jgi:phage baseplate assembly protein gpV
MSDFSKLRPYSLGIVAKNKPLDTNTIEVTPYEDMLMLDGELTDNISTQQSKGQAADGTPYQTSVDSTVTVTATWLHMGSNRRTAPDVRRGEKVMIYKFADVDKYYWASLEYDMKLRKLETVIYAISDTQKESEDGTADNTYYFEWSTHTKTVRLHTSKSDNEPYEYDILINAKDGNIMIQDDVGNFISFDSKNTRLEVKNADGTWIDLDKEDLTITVPGNLTGHVGKNATFDIGAALSITAGVSVTVNTPTAAVHAPNILLDGAVAVTGTSDLQGGVTMGSGGHASGEFNIENIKSDNEIDAPGFKP